MQFKRIKDDLHAVLTRDGIGLQDVDAAAGLAQVLSAYEQGRVHDAVSDKLLFEWGPYDWGEGSWFEYSITRQLIGNRGEDEDIWQLGLTFYYVPSSSTDLAGKGDRWCSTPPDVEELRAFIANSNATALIAGLTADHVALRLDCAG